MIASPRGPSGIGLSSMIAKCPTTRSDKSTQRHPAVALRRPVCQPLVFREELTQLLWVMRCVAVQHCLAGRSRQRKVEILKELSATPHRSRAET